MTVAELAENFAMAFDVSANCDGFVAMACKSTSVFQTNVAL